ncbi:MAG: translation elongation factor Ts [bacterium]|nr:translation elongation factor Ts [bacterium]
MEIKAGLVKELREKTGAGMMDCKKALVEAEGDVEKAIDVLRKKGRAKAEKRTEKEVSEGVIEAYIHPGSKLGVLLELNCETDFVAKTDDFKNLAKDLAMQVAAAMPMVVRREEVDPEIIERELDIFRTQAKNENKPEKVIEKIAEGKVDKYYKEVCLLEQPFIKDTTITVSDLITEMKAKIGENIAIKRFARFKIGES